ncbi:DUF423 domain-containing protein [Kordiimonas sp. SCSIO 12603]|uniref:DUF423 domain-containing protein n=1 Tax=Kordiimonas sp. SCSIO 12603 TaxID=2829596 RepID=UPI002101E60D|nr:DUF423 domain-containing protein [Kordiimonas sp. SCSIO 12603]UTW58052.1 DUF423 domain-containing protein [Kordiimonas sp. SCSIO 12603]
MKTKYILALAGLNGITATALAAIGSHAIKFEGKGQSLFDQAINFHFWHALAMIGAILLSQWEQKKTASAATICFMLGILFFSGSLYWRAIMGPGSLGSFHWITPIGGLSFMAGWLLLIIGALKAKTE